MRLVIALGGNALIERGGSDTVDAQIAQAQKAVRSIAPLARSNELLITHGNGPQVGILATQLPSTPFDTLVAQTQGMIGYWLLQALQNELGFESVASLLTQVRVDVDDPAFSNPTKYIGRTYSHEEAERLEREHGWAVQADGPYFRRVVPSPKPRQCINLLLIEDLLNSNRTVVCAGGGGIPVTIENNQLRGVEAVIDKDLTAAMLATELHADQLIILTDTQGIMAGFGTPDARLIRHTTPTELRRLRFPAGSMGPKVQAACQFVEESGKTAIIGSLAEANRVTTGSAGTVIHAE